MACLALALQPVSGPDVLLQTREWFHPARGAYASASFKSTRAAYAAEQSSGRNLGDDALSASSGQVVVGKENKYRVVYRLVNTVYVLGITSADRDDSANNIYECATVVNQAVSVLVAVCKGIDVSADRLARKYTEVYMTLDAVLHGLSAARLGFVLSSIHGDNVGQVFLSAVDAENRARGADSWNHVKGHSIERLTNVEALSGTTFELPEETLTAGDDVKATLAPAQASTNAPAQSVEEGRPQSEDPFAASDALTRPESLAGAFKKSKDVADVTAVLSELKVPSAATPGAAESTFVGVEGFEGEYGGLDFGIEDDGSATGFGDAFEGLTDAFGGGLDASDYGATKEAAAAKTLSVLEELERVTEGAGAAAHKGEDEGRRGASMEQDKPAEAQAGRPLLWLREEVFAEFRGLVLARTGLRGSLQLKTAEPTVSGQTDTEFSFLLEGAGGIKNGALQGSIASSLGQNYFHVRTPPADGPLTILKYNLHPRFTPLPLRLRLVVKTVGFLISAMIQYVSNPYLPCKLRDVKFVLSLPCSPDSLKVSPRATLDRNAREITWQVSEIALQSTPGRLRAQFPLNSEDDVDDANLVKRLHMKVRVEFLCKGTLSGITIRAAREESSRSDLLVGEHTFGTGAYCSVC